MASNDFVIIDEASTSSSSSFSASSSSLTSSSSLCSSITSSSSSCSSLTSSSSATTKLTINKTTSNKRKPMLTVHGYYFQMKNYNKAKTIKFWRCANRSCGVLLHTNFNDEFVRFSGSMTEHSHPPNPAELEIRNLREEMRKRAEHELLPLQEIAEQEVRKGLLTGEALAVLPNILNLGIPVVYSLLPDRKAFTYMYLFNILFSEAKKRNKTFDPSLIMTDFEPGTAKAISLEAIYRNVQFNGLSSTYLENVMVRSVIRRMMALALVPPEHVPSLFARLGEELNPEERDELLGLFKYFNSQWMKQIPMWNVFDISDRTNNYSEGM
ncbi:unnamed protein product [Rotaria sordida]|uniref:FLYWCH-type domain-containing protein n=1 Tax=Rotaria sordida TaxID=392033 RepID=A0A815YUW3_9BILA|nr:unnamed protein product [Rotaria sordida]CAF1574203.1 unnamed protein product [Rotaria sordida]